MTDESDWIAADEDLAILNPRLTREQRAVILSRRYQEMGSYFPRDFGGATDGEDGA